MKKKTSHLFSREIIIEYDKVNHLEEKLQKLQSKLDKKPKHFSVKDIARAFFGSIVFGFTFSLKGALIQTALNLNNYNISAIILSSITLMTGSIYYLGYRRIPLSERNERGFFQFWLKRIVSYYIIALFVSAFLIYIYNLNSFPGVRNFYDVFRIIISVSMPASLGATTADLLKQY